MIHRSRWPDVDIPDVPLTEYVLAGASQNPQRVAFVDGDSGINGTLDLHVNDVGATTSSALPETCADLGVDELGAGEAVFCVILVDTAGHRGAGDCTSVIAIE